MYQFLFLGCSRGSPAVSDQRAALQTIQAVFIHRSGSRDIYEVKEEAMADEGDEEEVEVLPECLLIG